MAAERIAIILLAAGSSTRMLGVDKVWADLGGEPLIARSLHAAASLDGVTDVIVVTAAKKFGLPIPQLTYGQALQQITELEQSFIKNGLAPANTPPHDAAFLRAHTNGPFLVREDTGAFLREGDVGGNGSKAYLVWDMVAAAPCLNKAAHESV